jgi:hypothetical protein
MAPKKEGSVAGSAAAKRKTAAEQLGNAADHKKPKAAKKAVTFACSVNHMVASCLTRKLLSTPTYSWYTCCHLLVQALSG